MVLLLCEYTYSQDLARAFMWCLDHYDDTQFLNVGSTEETTVKDTAFMIAEFMGIDTSRIEFDITKPAGIYRKATDNSRFVGLSNYKYLPFKEGLSRTVKWFKDNYSVEGKVKL